jgi:hypothetical protein
MASFGRPPILCTSTCYIDSGDCLPYAHTNERLPVGDYAACPGVHFARHLPVCECRCPQDPPCVGAGRDSGGHIGPDRRPHRCFPACRPPQLVRHGRSPERAHPCAGLRLGAARRRCRLRPGQATGGRSCRGFLGSGRLGIPDLERRQDRAACSQAPRLCIDGNAGQPGCRFGLARASSLSDFIPGRSDILPALCLMTPSAAWRDGPSHSRVRMGTNRARAIALVASTAAKGRPLYTQVSIGHDGVHGPE